MVDVGRDAAGWKVADPRVSREHFQVAGNGHIRDMDSANGTFVNGEHVPSAYFSPLPDKAVIRAGQSIFIFRKDASPRSSRTTTPIPGLSGRFHGPDIQARLELAAASRRHILLTGPSGCGKEVAANGLSMLIGNGRFIAHNAAQFTSAEEAVTSLFGVGPRVFSGVDARKGLIESAHQQVLFLDEVHGLPAHVQRSLLRVIEDGQISKVGEQRQRRVAVRFVFATNKDAPDYGIEHDLLARLSVVEIPPLSDRKADIPAIFMAVMEKARRSLDISSRVSDHIFADHIETLCIDGCRCGNVRHMQRLAEQICGLIAMGADHESAVTGSFHRQFPAGPIRTMPNLPRTMPNLPRTTPRRPPVHARHTRKLPLQLSSRESMAISEAHRRHGGNVKAIKSELGRRGYSFSRERIANLLDEMGLPRLHRGGS
jgi:DNA-binding NtrC family response regulator